MTEQSLLSLLGKRYRPPEWAFLCQVRNQTGYGHRRERYADAIAMNCYPSRGLELHGFEVKVSRPDWLRELQDPEKSADIQKYCNRWWIVTTRGIVQPGELPPTWGHLELKGRLTLAIRTQAPELEVVDLDRPFVASILRNAAGLQAGEDLFEAAREAGIKQERARQKDMAFTASQAAERRFAELQTAVKAFEEASGVQVGTRWQSGKIGSAARAVLESGTENALARFRTELHQLQYAAGQLEEAIKELGGP